ncbi:hypothetical protein TNCV_4090731 [Trichonephila clavipes]|uniref:Uncharacterized protein n=1 Tax=Trichonephila clavipes TaxID=2585209 RepID=A0A8X6S5Q0_TRICX|nr:hypothetical protein TNCV_4090731 [Trichonephila clavipes]
MESTAKRESSYWQVRIMAPNGCPVGGRSCHYFWPKEPKGHVKEKTHEPVTKLVKHCSFPLFNGVIPDGTLVALMTIVWPRYPNGYGQELVAKVSWYRFLLPLKTRRVDGVDAHSIDLSSMPFRWRGVVVRREKCYLRCCPHHLTEVRNF